MLSLHHERAALSVTSKTPKKPKLFKTADEYGDDPYEHRDVSTDEAVALVKAANRVSVHAAGAVFSVSRKEALWSLELFKPATLNIMIHHRDKTISF